MFWTTVGVLVALWLIGMFTSHRMAGLIHVLPAMAVVLLVVRLGSGLLQESLEESGRFFGEANNEPVSAGL